MHLAAERLWLSLSVVQRLRTVAKKQPITDDNGWYSNPSSEHYSAYPACWWTGADGVNRDAVDYWFGHLLQAEPKRFNADKAPGEVVSD